MRFINVLTCLRPTTKAEPVRPGRVQRTAESATFALNAAACVRRFRFVIWFAWPALCQVQTPAVPLIALFEFLGPPVCSEATKQFSD